MFGLGIVTGAVLAMTAGYAYLLYEVNRALNSNSS